MQTEIIHLPSLRNEEYYTFMNQVIGAAETNGLSEPFAELWAVFKARFEVLKRTLEVVRKSVFTAAMSRTDRTRSALHRDLGLRVRCALHYPDAPRRAAAVRLGNLIAHYGKLAGFSRDQKTGALDNLLHDLNRPDIVPDVTLLDLTGLLAMLGEAAAQYKSLKMQRNDEDSARPPTSAREARRAMNEVFREFRLSVDTRNTLVAPESLNAGVRALNHLIGHYNALIAQRAAARKARALAMWEMEREIDNAVPAAGV